MTHLQAIVFDVDGTIAMNAEDIHKLCVAQTLESLSKRQNVPFDFKHFEKIWIAGLGKGIAKCYNSYLSATPELKNSPNVQTTEEFEADYKRAYFTTGEKVIVREGVDELIRFAKDNGLKVAAVSNATQDILEHTLDLSLAQTQYTRADFDLVVGQDTVLAAGYEIKPHGGSYLYACHQMKVDPTNCIGFEDSISGYASLAHAGIGTRIYCENTPNDNFEKRASAFMKSKPDNFNLKANAVTLDEPWIVVRNGGGIGHLANLLSRTAETAIEHHAEEMNSTIGGAPASDNTTVHQPSFM